MSTTSRIRGAILAAGILTAALTACTGSSASPEAATAPPSGLSCHLPADDYVGPAGPLLDAVRRCDYRRGELTAPCQEDQVCALAAGAAGEDFPGAARTYRHR